MEGFMRDHIIRYFPLADRGLSPQAWRAQLCAAAARLAALLGGARAAHGLAAAKFLGGALACARYALTMRHI